MKRTIILTAAIGVLGTFAGLLFGEDEKSPTVDDIVKKANFVAYYQGADGKARVKMEIVDSQGRRRFRDLTILRWDAPGKAAKDGSVKKNKEIFAGEQKFYVYFHKPADISKMAFLVWKYLNKDDDRWLYLPKLDLVKRIAGSEKRTSFVGSDFFYEDISGRNISYDKHELVDTTKDYFVVKSTPKETVGVEFSYYKTWIHRKTFLVIKTEYYDSHDKAYRKYEAKAVKNIQGYWTVTKSRMTDLRTGRYTQLVYDSIKYDLDIPESIFTERYLRRPPTEYLKN